MPMELFFAVIAVLVLIVGSYTDIKTREVPDHISYGLIITGIASRLIWSLATYDWSYIIEGLIGLAAFLALGYAMFYAGQWGGGDSKVMMGLGAIIGIELNAGTFLIGFLFNTLIVGAVYAMIWSIAIAIRNRKKFIEEFRKYFYARKIKIARYFVSLSAAVLLLVILILERGSTGLVLASLVVLYLFTFYLWIFVRVVEKSCMLKLVEPEKLTEGDWIAKDVIVAGKKICGPKDLGIEMNQIKQLIKLKKQKKIKKILIKEGIPFVPSFLLAFLVTYIWGNLFFVFMNL